MIIKNIFSSKYWVWKRLRRTPPSSLFSSVGTRLSENTQCLLLSVSSVHKIVRLFARMVSHCLSRIFLLVSRVGDIRLQSILRFFILECIFIFNLHKDHAQNFFKIRWWCLWRFQTSPTTRAFFRKIFVLFLLAIEFIGLGLGAGTHFMYFPKRVAQAHFTHGKKQCLNVYIDPKFSLWNLA